MGAGIHGWSRSGAFTFSLSLLVAAVVISVFTVSAGAVVPEFLAKAPEEAERGTGAGHLGSADGVAADPNLPGNVYVADNQNNRVDVFTPWGTFIKAFGWGVKDGEATFEACTQESGCQKGLPGGGGGQLRGVEAITVDSQGNVYVIEGSVAVSGATVANRRVQKFGPEGEFLFATGGDVVAHGPDDSTNDEQQQLNVAASEGSFELGFENPLTGGGKQETASLPFNASTSEVEAALDALSTIGGLGGSVSVTGGPGNGAGSSPYTITFEGNLGGDDVPQLSIDRSALGPASIGGTLHCSTSTEAKSFEYRWLRNGTPIIGAETPTYTTTAADAGKSVQCQVTATIGEAASVQAVNPVYVAPPEAAVAPPVAPLPGTGSNGAFYAEIEGFDHLNVGGAGGQKLVCQISTWSGANSFAYQWYRNGVQIAGATESTYTVTQADLATRAYFQCAVTASNAGTATTTEFSGVPGGTGRTVTEPEPSPQVAFSPKVAMDPPSNVVTVNQGGAPEVCKAADVCKAGIAGRSSGQFGSEHYVNMIAVSPLDGSVFVGEEQHRTADEGAPIQVFNSNGTFREKIELPAEGSKTAEGLAVDNSGDLYISFLKTREETGGEIVREAEVRKLSPTGLVAEFLTPSFLVPSSESTGVTGLAVDPMGNLYMVAAGTKTDEGQRLLEFDSTGKCLDCGTQGEGGKAGFDRPSSEGKGQIRGVGVGNACNSIDIYSAHDTSNQVYLNIFGPPPSGVLCPPPEVPPMITSQFAVSVDTSSAELHARINPEFWNDTTYYVEYGTGRCSEGGCEEMQPIAPGQRLTTKTTNVQVPTAGVFLGELEPSTTYHYRFVAKSSGGGPVWGIDGSGGATFEQGLEGTFTTFRPAEAKTCPENETFRVGPSAPLPDCRAYELVSPLDKEGGDIVNLREETDLLPSVLDQSSLSGDKFAYGSYRAFGDAKAAPWTSQYVAARGEEGWTSHYILGPRGRVLAVRPEDELNMLSPDLCQAWFATSAEPKLAPGALVGEVNLYRRTDQECGGEEYEAFTTAPPPHEFGTLAVLQGASADGSKAIYLVTDNLTPEAPDLGGNGSGLYFQDEGEGQPHFVCILPSGAAVSGPCAGGTTPVPDAHGRKASLTGAISADGSRVFWSTIGVGANKLYVRENPAEAESAQLHGSATGTGDLIGPATGTGTVLSTTTTVSSLKTTSGGFTVGQLFSSATAGVIAPGTTVVACSPSCGPGATSLTLSAKPLKSKIGGEINGLASTTVLNVAAATGAFAAGQEISGTGIPAGATVVAVNEGEHKLTLSAQATASQAGVALSASSECTEAQTKACTIPVSAQAEGLSGAGGTMFWQAAVDGSVAIFSTGNGDLYEFNVDTETTKLIAHKAVGFMGASEDASRIYFASTEVLSGANPQGKAPIVGKVNLYFHEGESFHFVATLVGTNDPYLRGSVNFEPITRAARVAPDGLHAAFMSTGSLTGYDNTDAKSGEADAEVFRYDATANGGEGKLTCASCNPSGSRPAGRSVPSINGNHFGMAAQIPVWSRSLYPGRPLSDDGTRLFFESTDTLSPRDSNGAQDVYEWEAVGSGGCEESDADYSSLNEGCIFLISSGNSSGNASFLDASPSGSDVFFTTAASLIKADYGLIDVYDARVNGGLPEPPAPTPQCEGEACQGTPEAPNDPTPASESFQGAGNVHEEALARQPKSCAKGKVRRKGRCVSRHRKKAGKQAKHKRRSAR
jgi:hypothetical protein